MVGISSTRMKEVHDGNLEKRFKLRVGGNKKEGEYERKFQKVQMGRKKMTQTKRTKTRQQLLW